MTTDETITPSFIPEILLDTTPDSKTNTITQIFTSKGPVLSTHTLDLKEPKLREALVSLGWTPPKSEPESEPETLYPFEYSTQEGGMFKPWTFGPVNPKDLHLSLKSSGAIKINNIDIHSLIFETPAAGFNAFARWDCVNGWTTTLEEARKVWPKGNHNDPPWKQAPRFYPDSYMCMESDLVETINRMLSAIAKNYPFDGAICGGFTIKEEVSDPSNRFCTIYPIPVKLPTSKETS